LLKKVPDSQHFGSNTGMDNIFRNRRDSKSEPSFHHFMFQQIATRIHSHSRSISPTRMVKVLPGQQPLLENKTRFTAFIRETLDNSQHFLSVVIIPVGQQLKS
jgi:hypothetical protein